MTNCSGKLITSVAVALHSFLLEIQVYEKYFYGTLLPFSELKAWVCFYNTFQETESQERKIKRKLISSLVAQEAINILGCPVSTCPCLEQNAGLSTWDGPGHEVVM